jgi:phage-related protein
MAKIITVSINEKQDEALKTMGLSASKLLQDAIDDKIEQFNLGMDFSQKRTDELQKKLDEWKKIVYRQRDYLENKGLLDDFIKQDGY